MQGKKISDTMEHFFLDNTITCLINKASVCAFHSPNQVVVDDLLPLMVGVGGFKFVPLTATVYLLPALLGLGLDILRARVVLQKTYAIAILQYIKIVQSAIKTKSLGQYFVHSNCR